MNSKFKSKDLLEAVAFLNDLYKLGEPKMAFENNFKIVNDALHKVNVSITTFTSLCSHLDATDIIPGNTFTKLVF